ncbi:hypothetical protein ABTZ58_35915 [Streptomyces sp. NPDC094143]|uniref:hypothetical protein n=1 Tax=Streptomyces sp. NPDC094143 TaxID=3155310 RepID=UPI003332557B
MSSFSPSRSRRIAAAASILTAVSVLAGVLVLALSARPPQAWWPRTGHAFAPEDCPGPHRPVPEGTKERCDRGVPAYAARRDTAGEVLRLVPVGAGLVALLIWRQRAASGRGRADARRGRG